MRHTRLQGALAVVATGLVVAVGTAVLGQQGPAPKESGAEKKATATATAAEGQGPADSPATRTLARQQLAVIDQALNNLTRMARGGEVDLADPKFALWERRRLEALRASGAEKAERVAALDRFVAFMKRQEQIVEELNKRDMRSAVDFMDAKYLRMEAEIWRNREQAR